MAITRLYHGSVELVTGELVPKKPQFRVNEPGDPVNEQKGIYAADNHERAIAFGLRKLVIGEDSCVMMIKDKPEIVVIKGELPVGGTIYLYELPLGEFEQTKQAWQWFSQNSIRPLSIKTLDVEDHLHLIRKADSAERIAYYQNIKSDAGKKL